MERTTSGVDKTTLVEVSVVLHCTNNKTISFSFFFFLHWQWGDIHTLVTEEFTRNIQSFTSNNNNLLTVKSLLGDNGSKTTQQMALTINDDSLFILIQLISEMELVAFFFRITFSKVDMLMFYEIKRQCKILTGPRYFLAKRKLSHLMVENFFRDSHKNKSLPAPASHSHFQGTFGYRTVYFYGIKSKHVLCVGEFERL
jgi:hypothetical protein